MFEYNSITQENFGKTKVINKTINLGKNLDLFITASCKNTAFLDYLFNKILDYSIDKISSNNTYKDFSHSLELINTVLKAWNNEGNEEKINMIIGVLNKNEFLFSTIGKSSCYLVKKNTVIEITDKRDIKKEFSFISNGTLEHKDIIVMSSKRLLNFLSESDFIDSYNTKIEKFNNSIKQILEEEKIEKNIAILSFIYKDKKKEKKNKKLEIINNILYKILDTNLVKRIIALWLIIKEKFLQKGKIIKTAIFISIILFTIFCLYSIITSNLSDSKKKIVTKNQIEKLEEAKTALRLASESISNKDIYELNIKKTKEIINKLEEKKLFIEDIKLLKEKIARLNKTFEGIESFNENENNKITEIKGEKAVKIVGLNKKIYIIGKNYIKGPIVKGVNTKKIFYNELKDDEFIDATSLVNKIVLLTKKGNIILFSTNGNFITSNVIGQKKWEESNIVQSYNSNIYLISKTENQIFKHKKTGNNFTKGIPYLKKQDQKTIKEMESIAIDGGFYILKKDLKIVKFFANPRYRIEKLILNNFPSNYEVEDKNAPLKIKTRSDLNYVYILLNNKIYITKPNSRRHQDTKSLRYLGQIEGQKYKIIDFYIKHDGELIILNKNGLYKLNFEEEEGKIIVR